MNVPSYKDRVRRCADAMRGVGLDALLLTKPSNMFYLCGDGRLCAYLMVTRDGRAALGVPVTDLEDVKALARFDEIEGFENEVGMIHSIAHFFSRFGLASGTIGLEYTFLTQSMMGMLTHPHAKPAAIAVGNCGLYTGAFGVRVEDTVVVGDAGPRVLTTFPRSLSPRDVVG